MPYVTQYMNEVLSSWETLEQLPDVLPRANSILLVGNCPNKFIVEDAHNIDRRLFLSPRATSATTTMAFMASPLRLSMPGPAHRRR
jgi:hypothetical protein